jgi:hypothetical protein
MWLGRALCYEDKDWADAYTEGAERRLLSLQNTNHVTQLHTDGPSKHPPDRAAPTMSDVARRAAARTSSAESAAGSYVGMPRHL